MKKYIKAFIIAVAFLSLSSCEREFIAPWPPDAARTSEDIWGYYKYAKGVLDDIYARYIFCPHMNEVYGTYGMMACATDEAEHSMDKAKVQTFTNGNWNATSSPTVYYGGAQVTRNARHPWVNDYLIIRKANTFLASVDTSILIDDLNDPTRRYDRTWAKGQAYFWRAYAEFDMFRRYGRYVISTKVEEVADPELFRDRNTLEECYNQIIKDCDSAIDSLPLLWDEDNWGRINRTAAQALKSRAMLYYASPLYQGDWDTWGNLPGTVGEVKRWVDAADAARNAINDNDFYQLTPISAGGTAPTKSKPGTNSASGSYNYIISMTDGLDNHAQIWTGERTTTASTFWERYNLPAGIEGFNGYTNPTQEMVDAFEVVTGPANNRTAEAFDWNNPTHAANPYANRDPRFYASILYNGYFWGNSGTKGYYIDTYEGGVHRDVKLPNSTKTGYYHRKFLSEAWYAYKTGSYTTQKRARHEFRFAELVLNYAEALNEAYGPEEEDPNGMLRSLSEEEEEGGICTAKDAINAIRTRVGMPELRPEQYASQAAMRETIHHERQIELCFEGHRFYDVRRWKEGEKFGQPIHGIKITPTGFGSDSRPTGYTYEVVKVEDRVWEDKMYWWPIPYSEVVKYKKSGSFTQNPGWE
ncbi:MAG: RagB/SusD family nutrient uptake outer membrane protein [Bacteroidales bacterium]|nr:RagB/SusD family nutrient uptake outer membrane protein [Bacteroidales bacterium]